jgi:transcriptional regulator with XRE-family HTH domain
MRVRDPATLRAYVRLLGLSERGLAARAGVGHATVNHLLSGRRTQCARRTARAIEAALGCPPGVFFDSPTPAEQRDIGTPSRESHDPQLPLRTPVDGVLESGTAHG